jgi:multiple antibiotic resistance protein
MELTLELIGYVLTVVFGIVPIINPFSTAPVFISMTGDATVGERNRIARRACIYMGLLLLVFLALGAMILEFFGISQISLRVAGGLVIAYMGFRMLFPQDAGPVQRDLKDDPSPQDIAFVPLALPMLCGPGSISVVMAMATRVHQAESFVASAAGFGIVAVGILISSFICWLVLVGSGGVVRFLGKTGIDAASKIMGFLLICIGVEFVISVHAELFPG